MSRPCEEPRILKRSLVSVQGVIVPVQSQTINVNPITEHALYLRLFVTNGGGW